jgi:hypothetical protein
MNVIAILQKIAGEVEEPALVRFARENPGAAVIPTGAALGGLLTRDDRAPIASTLVGMGMGAGTGASALLGGYLGNKLTGGSDLGTVGGGGLGGLLGLLALQRLLMGDERQPKRREKKSGTPLEELRRVKVLSDRRDYQGKHGLLHSLIERYPEDFFIDSTNGDIVGITHRPTGFRVHAPVRIIPTQLRSTVSHTSPGEMTNALPAAA